MRFWLLVSFSQGPQTWDQVDGTDAILGWRPCGCYFGSDRMLITFLQDNSTFTGASDDSADDQSILLQPSQEKEVFDVGASTICILQWVRIVRCLVETNSRELSLSTYVAFIRRFTLKRFARVEDSYNSHPRIFSKNVTFCTNFGCWSLGGRSPNVNWGDN